MSCPTSLATRVAGHLTLLSISIRGFTVILTALPSRCLHRALDRKVRKLRSMLSADEDITTELDRVVCRLMKLALRTTRRRQCPLPMKWMQCKMLDLLNLTEKAIEKKKRHCIETYPLKAICYGIFISGNRLLCHFYFLYLLAESLGDSEDVMYTLCIKKCKPF